MHSNNIPDELKDSITSLIAAGISKYMASRERSKDIMSKKEAQDYCRLVADKHNLFVRKQSGSFILKEWTEQGYIKGERLGTARNSKIYYRKSDVDEIVATIKMTKSLPIHLRN